MIRAFQDEGWIYYGETTIWKDPQAQSIRTRAFSLAFQTKNRDSAGSRPALADYLLIFKEPGVNEVRIPHEAESGEVTNDDWIDWASPIWRTTKTAAGSPTTAISAQCGLGSRKLTPQHRRRTGGCRRAAYLPLQLRIHRPLRAAVVQPGRAGADPFAGIGSELYQAVKRGRRAVGIELKLSYWQTAVSNLTVLESQMAMPSLFELGPRHSAWI